MLLKKKAVVMATSGEIHVYFTKTVRKKDIEHLRHQGCYSCWFKTKPLPGTESRRLYEATFTPGSATDVQALTSNETSM